MCRTAREVLNELRWRKGRDLGRAEIWVADRTRPGGGRILSGAEVRDLGHGYFTTSRATIPFYKIEKIVYEGRILFERPDPAAPFRAASRSSDEDQNPED